MWIFLALLSALGLGFYDVMKKLSVRDNNVPVVLWLNTMFVTLLMSPVLVGLLRAGHIGLDDSFEGHILIGIKAVIVLSSWILGYFAIKHLPLTIQGPINASRPVLVLVGAIVVYGEHLNAFQWLGILLGFLSLFLISRIGGKEGLSMKRSRWLWMTLGATLLGAVSALYDKFLVGRYDPLEVQFWYSFYQMLLMTVIAAMLLKGRHATTHFRWRWTIVGISCFLTAADIAYFYALSLPGAMIAVVSMIRRGSVFVPFLYGALVLHERNVKAKLIDLSILVVSLVLLIIGSNLDI